MYIYTHKLVKYLVYKIILKMEKTHKPIVGSINNALVNMQLSGHTHAIN